jgi:RNA polymerase sigma-70 factor (ECF subfamily)
MSLEIIPLEAQPDATPALRAVEAASLPVRAARFDSPADAYDAYFEVAWRNLRRLGVEPDSIEDAVQDVFLVVHRKWETFCHQSTVRTWVIGICVRVARDYRRKRLRVVLNQDLDNSIAISPDCPAATVERLQATRTLMALLDGLGEDLRNVLVLVELEELSVSEAADAIGIPVSTAYKRLTKAHQLFERAVSRQHAQNGWRFGWMR